VSSVSQCKEGLLIFVPSWYCEIPNGTLRAYAFLKSKMLEYVKMLTFLSCGRLHAYHSCRSCIDVNATGNYTLIQAGSCAHLVGIRQADNKGNVEQVYYNKDTEARTNTAFGAVFASRGQAILFGSLEGCVLVWDQKKGSVVYGLEHGEGMVKLCPDALVSSLLCR